METMSGSIDELIENEWYVVRNSGETPEIALHSALYYLTVSHDGPRICLSEEQVLSLQQAAADRYSEIIVRDLQHANSGTPGYRGITRSIINYRRFCTFCERQKVDRSAVRRHAAAALLTFLHTEVTEVGCCKRRSIINCRYEELKCFAADLGIELDDRFAGLAEICADAE